MEVTLGLIVHRLGLMERFCSTTPVASSCLPVAIYVGRDSVIVFLARWLLLVMVLLAVASCNEESVSDSLPIGGIVFTWDSASTKWRQMARSSSD
jgi:hypothetical protein